MRRLAEQIAPVLLLALLIGSWEAACRLMDIKPYFLPAPSAIWSEAVKDAPLLALSAWGTLSRAFIALVVASAVSSLLALAVSLSGILERAVRPLVVTLQVTPIIAIAPIVQIWAGVAHPERAVIALAAIVAFFPIFSGALTGMKAIDPDLERLFRLYGATRWQTLTRLRIPSAVPFVLEGHKVAAGLALVGAVISEFAAAGGGVIGLAWRIQESLFRLQTAKAFAALLILGVMGAVVYGLLGLAERRILAWWRGR
jgi:NitT/TauT family transport system permease protein